MLLREKRTKRLLAEKSNKVMPDKKTAEKSAAVNADYSSYVQKSAPKI